MELSDSRKSHGAIACGAETRGGGWCQKQAGWGTDHFGSGRCRLHGGNAGRPIETGQYSRYGVIKSSEARSLREHFEADLDPLNLLPDVLELRALVADYRNRHDEITLALLAWHASFGPGWEQAAQDWRRSYSDWHARFVEISERCNAIRKEDMERAENLEGPPAPPSPEDCAVKPRRVVDILQVGQFIAHIGGLVEKIHKRDVEKGISLLDVADIIKRHGIELVAVAHETITDDAQRAAFLSTISDRWDAIPIAIARGRRA